jgi:hypothetical protein
MFNTDYQPGEILTFNGLDYTFVGYIHNKCKQKCNGCPGAINVIPPRDGCG